MSNVVKCDKCNIVIDEMLSYIQNKVSIADEMTLVRICLSSFSGDEIKKSKALLFDSVPTKLRKIVRENKGKEKRDITDIINLFKSANTDEIPVFVARQLERLPPLDFNHLDCTKLLKDILKVQTEIAEVKSTYATLEQIKELKAELLRIKHDSLPPPRAFVNTRRGAWLSDSGPVGLSHNSLEEECSEKCINEYRDIMEVEDKSTECKRRLEADDRALQITDSASDAFCDEPIQREGVRSSATVTSECAAASACAPTRSERITAKQQLTADSGSTTLAAQGEFEPTHVENNNHGPWNKVSYGKKTNKYRYHGKSGLARDTECNFKAADKHIPIFITNIHSETTEDDIVKYIHGKTQDSVYLEKITMKKEKGHKAYKFFVPESKLSRYLDENFWPQGIVFRRFVHFKNRSPNRVPSVDGLNKKNYE